MELEGVRKQLEDVEEVETEMELMDEEEQVMYVQRGSGRSRAEQRTS